MRNNDVENIKERLNIVDVVGEYVTLQKAGKNFRGLSPFTPEKTPSFFVSPDRQLFHCFSSSRGGDVFTFIQEMEGVDFYGALKICADKAGITLSTTRSKDKGEYDVLYQICDEATAFFEKALVASKSAQEYVASRGISADTTSMWRIGYAPDEWRALLAHLRSKGYKDADILRAGLIKESSKPSAQEKYYDTFRGRVMFPLRDVSGRVVAFSGRILAKDVDAPKYVNSPETPLYNKSELLYGLDMAKNDIRRQDYAVLVEGQMDVVLCHQYGLKNAVASSGTALTPEQISTLKRYSRRIIVAFDSDRAGVKASVRNAELGMQLGMDVKVAPLPEGKDPADMLTDDPQTLKDVLAASQHIVDFYVDRIVEAESDARVVAKRVRDEVLPLVAGIPSAIERSHFIQRIALGAEISEKAVWDDFTALVEARESAPRAGVSKDVQDTTVPRTPRNIVDIIVRDIWGISLWQKEEKTPALDPAKTFEHMKDIVTADVFQNYHEEYEGEKNSMLFEAETKYNETDNLAKVVDELFIRLEQEMIRERLSHVMRKLTIAEKKGDESETQTLLTECQTLSQRMAQLTHPQKS